MIEDNGFTAARSEMAEDVIVGQGSVLSMGVYVGSSTKIVYRDTAAIITGLVPMYSVVVPSTLGGGQHKDGSCVPNLYCAATIKKVDARTLWKASVNELL